jgi:thiamine-phosphate pyrophosphorylase
MALDFERRGADYVAFGSFFASPTKPLANVIDLDVLDEAKEKLTIPICAIGGISTHNLDSVLSRKPDMICVVSDIWSSNDVQNRSSHYAAIIHNVG